jgi:hypothetical protein
MGSVDGLLGELDDVVARLAAVDLAAVGAPERFAVLARLETQQRRLTAIAHAGVAALERFEGCPPVGIALADALRIHPKEAKRRIRDAAQLAARTALTGNRWRRCCPQPRKSGRPVGWMVRICG